MDACRICLAANAKKDIFKSQHGQKSCVDLFMICLNIQVEEDTKISTNLCLKCYKKLCEFYEFKILAVKSNVHLTSINKVIELNNKSYTSNELPLHDISKETNDIKEEVIEYDTSLNNDDIPQNSESDDECLSDIKKIKYEFIEEEHCENVDAQVTEKIPKKTKRKKKGEETSTEPKSKIKKIENPKQICDVCGKSVKKLKEHLLQHQPGAIKKQIQCSQCDKTYTSTKGLQRHVKATHLGIRHKCPICGKLVIYLRTHIRIMHDHESLPFECASCGKRFTSKSALAVHVTTHTKDKPYSCDVCNKNFSTKAWMSMHKRAIHNKEKSHTCDYCGERFFQKSQLKIHIRVHTGEKPYKCRECGKFYRTASSFKNHQRLHKDEKSFSCELCDKSFKVKSSLFIHMQSHTKEKRYPCNFCNVKFHRSNHRNRHEYTAHKKFLQTTPTPAPAE